VMRHDGSVQSVGRPGALIGVLENPALHDDALTLAAGDTVVLYTDGVTDARGPDGHFGAARLTAVLEMLIGLPPARIVDRIDRAIAAYRTGDPTDDSAIVAIRRCPDPPEARSADAAPRSNPSRE
jgi:serine phosphatase RsbU (regulator of sigma subunit)